MPRIFTCIFAQDLHKQAIKTYAVINTLMFVNKKCKKLYHLHTCIQHL